MAYCYVYPARRFLQRSPLSDQQRTFTLKRMLLGAGLSGVPLLATWGGVMWVYNLVSALTTDPVTKQNLNPDAGAWTQAASASGAALGCLLAALLGDRIGRRPAYALMCISSAIVLYSFYRFNTEFNLTFLLMAGLVGLITASFYGWLPLYLPELFPTAMRATGQGFSFNFGRVLAAIGSLQTGALVAAFADGDTSKMTAAELAAVYAKACSVAAGVYLVGLMLIALAPETRGKDLPE
jgi:MFS family permease